MDTYRMLFIVKDVFNSASKAFKITFVSFIVKGPDLFCHACLR